MERKVGDITHFFPGPSAAVLKLTSRLKVGDQIHITGATTDQSETVTSMQIDHKDVESAWPGDDVAILVKDRVREGDEVFLVEEDVAEQPAWMSTPALPAASGMATPQPKPTPAAPKPAASAPKPAAKPKAKAKAKPKKAKAKAKPKAKAKKAKAKAKPKARAKKAKAKGKVKKKKK